MHPSIILIQAINEHPGDPYHFTITLSGLGIVILSVAICMMLLGAYRSWRMIRNIYNQQKTAAAEQKALDFSSTLAKLTKADIDLLLARRTKGGKSSSLRLILIPITIPVMLISTASAKTTNSTDATLLNQTGILITITLLLIPALAALAFLVLKVRTALTDYRNSVNKQQSEAFLNYLDTLSDSQLQSLLDDRSGGKIDNQLPRVDPTGKNTISDPKGLLEIGNRSGIPFFSVKKRALKRPEVDPGLSRLIMWYLGCAAFWLVFATTIGEYLGIKFIAPDADHLSWLSFGRLRPIHTNAVFWGWASLAMLGLGHYVIPRISNAELFSQRLAWYALGLINLSVLAGTFSLMAGLNNAGGEYREYIWPVMLLFAAGLVITLYNFLHTVARRTTKEIYISGWYIISSIIFAIIITLVAYIPNWQEGLGETIIQGYYMHQGVGMWFMLFCLGLVYYFLPQQLNRPIYSYSLGILAFWTQILFYTTIGTHHFVFSAIPWWLQTVAIVGSVGMIIPVVAGTTNFLITFKGAWHKLRYSYTLPFFLVGIIFYFTGSLQGTAEAFRYTNLIWHFTDFTVAHSHLTMYGIISFLLWACIYAILPRLTGREAPQATIGAHFWLALIGLMFYTIPLMYGSTLRGLMWMESKPFIDSVIFMAPYWLWRAIGGSLMWLSHLFFAYNLYKMATSHLVKDVTEFNQSLLRKEDSFHA